MPRQLQHEEVKTRGSTFPLCVACDDWSDPLNVGAAFRLADAFGVAELVLGGSTPLPPHRRIRRTARSTDAWVPYRHAPDLPTYLRECRAAGYVLLGLEIADDSVPLADYEVGPHDRLMLVAGGEAQGIQPAVLDLLDTTLYIPLHGRNSSMNVITALGVGLYAITQQLQAH